MTGSEAGRVSRRNLLTGVALGAASLLLPPTVASAAPSYEAVPKLPYEVARADTQTTRIGKKKFEIIDIEFSGDRSRILVPHGVTPGKSGTPANIVWFYHSFGSTHEAMTSAYLYSAMMCLDRGWVCIGPNFGGDQWVNTRAIWFQKEISRYMGTFFNIQHSFLRANSGGGALMSYAYGKRSVPQVRGMYLANAVYDMEDIFQRDPVRVGPAYNNDPALVAATNPARLHINAWMGTRIRSVVSASDEVVPPQSHGVALVEKALPVAREATLVWHDGGHYVPDLVHADMVSAFTRWQTA